MDSLTHIALGACVGEAFFERGFGKKAMLWGALAQSVPDIDFVASFWMPTAENLLAHRGFTHSLLFAALVIPVLAMSADRIHRPHNISFRRWLYFFAAEVLLHLFLDAFNNYGIGWFEPFSSARYSFNTIYVADLFFSLWPGIALVVLLVLNRYHPRRRFWWRFGMILPFLYLGYCVANKLKMDQEIRTIVDRQGIPRQKYFTTPAPLQNWLWYVVTGDDKGYYIGFRSVFDSKKEIEFEYFPRNDSLLEPIADHEDLQQLIRFSQGFYTVEKWNDTLVFNDLRFGQIIGWENKRGRFVFHYYLQHPEDNELVVQRGRFAGWNRQTFFSMLRRIRGN
jgi:inner membrane protein